MAPIVDLLQQSANTGWYVLLDKWITCSLTLTQSLHLWTNLWKRRNTCLRISTPTTNIHQSFLSVPLNVAGNRLSTQCTASPSNPCENDYRFILKSHTKLVDTNRYKATMNWKTSLIALRSRIGKILVSFGSVFDLTSSVLWCALTRAWRQALFYTT